MLPASIAQAATLEVVASGLNNPRGLDFAPNGALFIAEAGTGVDPSPGTPGLELSLSGSVTRVFKGSQQRIVTGLPSLLSPNGVIGPSDVSFGQLGHAALTIGLGQDPDERTTLGAEGADLGTLWQMNQNGKLKFIADLAAFEAAENPDGNLPDSNPQGALNDRGGRVYTVDAGANALLAISAKGAISVVAVFPNLPTPPMFQSVPTNVVRGPDGALYVSELTGFPFPLGAARIYRVVPGSAPAIYAQGFTNVIDLEFDVAGNLYVLEIDTNGILAPSVMGRLARINAVDQSVDTVASDGLIMPGGIAIGPDGAIYVSNYSTTAGAGEVVRIQP